MSGITAADLARLRVANDTLATQTRRDLSRAWAAMDLSNPRQARDDLLQVVDALGSRGDSDARVLAMEWYEDVREKVGGLPRYTARAGGHPNHDRMIATARWAAGGLWGDNPDQVKELMEQAMDRWQWAAANDAIVFNAVNDKSCRRWARVPSGAKTCAFCTMLASRGWVYATYRSAGGEAAHQFHEGCDCLVVPNFESKIRSVYLEGYDPDRYLQLYKRGIDKAADGSRSAILAGMRQADPDQYTDGVWPECVPHKDDGPQGVNMRLWEQYRRDLAFRLPPDADTTRFKVPPKKPAEVAYWPDDLPTLGNDVLNHACYGDRRRNRDASRRDHHRGQNGDKVDWQYRGGHLSGYGWMSGGTSFPSSWTPATVQNAAVEVLRNGAATRMPNGFLSYTGRYDGARLVVVVDLDGRKVRTVYPVK